jgi:tetratricopeptide (TPR) repeat protein
MRRRLAGLLIALASLAPAFAASFGEADARTFDEANRYYRRGQYQEALRIYEDLMKIRGPTRDLCYNAGNAAFQVYRDTTATNREGKLAAAIRSYEMARRLSPSDEDVAHNLDFSRRLVSDRIQAPEPNALMLALFFYYYLASVPTLTLLAAIAFLLAGMAATARLLLPRDRESLRMAGAVVLFVALGLWAILLASAIVKHRSTSLEGRAWVRTESADVRTEPRPDAPVALEIHEGTRVRMVGTVENWIQVRLEDGRRGWIPEERLLR